MTRQWSSGFILRERTYSNIHTQHKGVLCTSTSIYQYQYLTACRDCQWWQWISYICIFHYWYGEERLRRWLTPSQQLLVIDWGCEFRKFTDGFLSDSAAPADVRGAESCRWEWGGGVGASIQGAVLTMCPCDTGNNQPPPPHPAPPSLWVTRAADSSLSLCLNLPGACLIQSAVSVTVGKTRWSSRTHQKCLRHSQKHTADEKL